MNNGGTKNYALCVFRTARFKRAFDTSLLNIFHVQAFSTYRSILRNITTPCKHLLVCTSVTNVCKNLKEFSFGEK